MIISVDRDRSEFDSIDKQSLSELNILERSDLQEWFIENPTLAGEDLLVVTSEFDGFEQTYDRLDILALDRAGKLVVIELKRDKADQTTDLQAIKYASYCATLTPRQVQELYREFWNDREDGSLSAEDVGEKFADFLNETGNVEVQSTEDGWADFRLDDRPRVLLVAGEFGVEITSPVLWLVEEFGMDIGCVLIEAYEHKGDVLLYSRQLIPIPETEEYMTRRRDKSTDRATITRRRPAIDALLDRDQVNEDDIVCFNDRVYPVDKEAENRDQDFWRARITGRTGRSNNVQWLWNEGDKTHSFTGLTKRLLNELDGRDPNQSLNGYKYWCPEGDTRSLSTIRNETD